MKARMWGVCSECFETVGCRKDPSGYTVLKHTDCQGEDCLGSGCEPLSVLDGDQEIILDGQGDSCDPDDHG